MNNLKTIAELGKVNRRLAGMYRNPAIPELRASVLVYMRYIAHLMGFLAGGG